MIISTKQRIDAEINGALTHFLFSGFEWLFVFNLEVTNGICGASSQVFWEQKFALNLLSALVD